MSFPQFILGEQLKVLDRTTRWKRSCQHQADVELLEKLRQHSPEELAALLLDLAGSAAGAHLNREVKRDTRGEASAVLDWLRRRMHQQDAARRNFLRETEAAAMELHHAIHTDDALMREDYAGEQYFDQTGELAQATARVG
jgi:hypothetical protein